MRSLHPILDINTSSTTVPPLSARYHHSPNPFSMRLKKLTHNLPPHVHPLISLLISKIHLSTTTQYLLTPAHTIFDLLLASHADPHILRLLDKESDRIIRGACWNAELESGGFEVLEGEGIYNAAVREEIESFRWMGTGLEGLDELLSGLQGRGGGGLVIEIAGTKESGRSVSSRFLSCLE